MEENILTKREKRQLAKEEKKKGLRKASVTKQIRNWSIGIIAVGILVFGGYRVWKWATTPVEIVDTQSVSDKVAIAGVLFLGLYPIWEQYS